MGVSVCYGIFLPDSMGKGVANACIRELDPFVARRFDRRRGYAIPGRARGRRLLRCVAVLCRGRESRARAAPVSLLVAPLP